MNFSGKDFWYDWGGANEWIFRQVNSLHGDAYDAVMIALSKIADHHNFPYYLVGLFVFALLAYSMRKLGKRGGTKLMIEAWFGVFVMLAAGYAAEGAILHFAKDYFSFPRPYIALGNDVRVLEIRPPDDNYHSFPSGHAAFITMMIAGLWPVLSKNMKLFGVALIFGVMWSRLALGVHFPMDVVTSVVLFSLMMIIMRSLIYWMLLRLFGLKC